MGRDMAQALVAGLPPRRTGFDPRPVREGLVTDKVTQGQGFHRIFHVFPMSIIPPMTHGHLSTIILLRTLYNFSNRQCH